MEQKGELSTDGGKIKNQKLETEACDKNYLPETKLKNEIIKIYNNNINNEDNNSFIIDNEQTLIDTIKIKKVFGKSKTLILEIMTNDSSSEKYSKIEINPFGYINSKRKNKDGITYFGNSLEKGNRMGDNIDVEIKNNENYYDYEDDGLYGRHFMIKFNPDDLNYYIKDLGKGTGTFIKIQEWTEIKNNSLLNIGENYIVLSYDDEDDVDENDIINNSKDNGLENYINIKVFSINSQIKSQKFFPSDCPITIGRSNENNIFIDDDMLSRIHCTIDFENKKWYIQDGFAKKGLREEEIKKSTNGCWIYAYEEIPIENKMVFKANHNLFICNLT